MAATINYWPPAGGGGGADPWATAVGDTMLAAVPTLTRFEYLKVGQNSLGAASGAVVGDAFAVGGGMAPTAGASRLFGAAVYQTPKTTGWGVAFYAKLIGPTVARVATIGIANVGVTAAVQIRVDPATDATHYVLQVFGAGTTNVASTSIADNVYHSFVLTCNGVTLRMFIDGVEVASTTTLTNLTDQAMYLFAFNTIGGEATVHRIFYGYIDPTV